MDGVSMPQLKKSQVQVELIQVILDSFSHVPSEQVASRRKAVQTTKDSNMKAPHAFNDHANGRRVLEQVWSNIGKVESANQGLQDVMKAFEALLHFIKQTSEPGFDFEVELIPPLVGHLQTIARVAGQKGIVSLVFTDGADGLLGAEPNGPGS